MMQALAPIPPDLAALGPTPEEIQAHVEGLAVRTGTPCGDGQMVWRSWGQGAPLVLLHGGYGSWSHWIRNVLPLARHRRVIAADLPGLGGSAAPPEPHSAESLADILVAGLEQLLPRDTKLELVGFSFGGVVGGHVAARLGTRLRRFVIVGSNGFGLPRADLAPMGSWRRAETREERLQVHRQTLAAMMFADATRIDPVALHLQEQNAEAGRVRSPAISITDTLRRVLPLVRAPLTGIWGGEDNIARGNIEARHAALRDIQPGVDFHTVPGAGHWVSYEAASAFNATLLRALEASEATLSASADL
jgi:pimeloyl-ACP methyl ester carboxylesterase